LVAAKVCYLTEHYDASLQAAESALAREPKLTHGLRLSLLAKHALGQTNDSLPLIHQLQTAGVLSEANANRFTVTAFQQQLTHIQGEANLQAWFNTLSPSDKENPNIVQALCERYMQVDAFKVAAELAAPLVLKQPELLPSFAGMLFRLLPYIPSEACRDLDAIAKRTLMNTSSNQTPTHGELSLLLARLALLHGDIEAALGYDMTHVLDHAAQSHLLRYYAYLGQRAFAEANQNQTAVFDALARYYHFQSQTESHPVL
jgi:uncharacterized protein HemY